MAVVVAVGIAAFAAAFLLSRGDDGSEPPADVAAGNRGSTGTSPSGPAPEGACGTREPVEVSESPYRISVQPQPDPPQAEDTTFAVRVERDGEPVSGARVCLSADMTEMSHTGVDGEATEVAPGRYELTLDFSMRGGWTGSVLVAEPGQQSAFMPVSFEVR